MSNQWFQAAKDGDIQFIQQNVHQYIKSVNQDGLTALMLAAIYQHQNIIELLSQYEANAQTQKGYTALMLGILNNNPKVVELLPTEYETKNQEGTTPLMLAIANNYPYWHQLINTRHEFNQAGLSAWFIAVLQQNDEYISKFSGEEMGRISLNGTTSLMVAASAGNIDLVQKIVKFHPELLKKVDQSSKSALIFACETLTQILDGFQQNKQSKIDDSTEQQVRDYISIINILFRDEHNIASPDNVTMLMYCAKFGLVEHVQSLLNQVRAQDNQGKTALMYAAEMGKIQIVEILQEQEAQMQDKKGMTACAYACLGDQYEAFLKLVEDEYSIKDNQQRHLVHYACQSNAEEIVEAVWETFINQKDDNGVTGLMVAAQYGSAQCIKPLLKEVNEVDKEGYNALHYAIKYDKPKCCRELLQHLGKKKYTESLLDFALRNHVYKVIPILLNHDTSEHKFLLIDLAKNNHYKACKVICDVGRTAQCEVLCGNIEYTSKEQSACKKQLQLLTQNYPGYNNDFTALHIAVLAGSYEAVRVLTPVFYQSCNKSGITPLMLLVQKEQPQIGPYSTPEQVIEFQQYKKACQMLCDYCSGMQTTKNSAVPIGTTALMIGIMAMAEVNNSYIIKKLFPIEAQIVDKNGDGWQEIAKKLGVMNKIQQLQNYQYE